MGENAEVKGQRAEGTAADQPDRSMAGAVQNQEQGARN